MDDRRVVRFRPTSLAEELSDSERFLSRRMLFSRKIVTARAARNGASSLIETPARQASATGLLMMDHNQPSQRSPRTPAAARAAAPQRFATGIALLLCSAIGATVIASRTPRLNGSAEVLVGGGHSLLAPATDQLQGEFGHSLTVSDSTPDNTMPDKATPAHAESFALESRVHRDSSIDPPDPSFAVTLQWSGGGHSLVEHEPNLTAAGETSPQVHVEFPELPQSGAEQAEPGDSPAWREAPRLPERTPTASPLAGLTGSFGHSYGPRLDGPQFRAVAQSDEAEPADSESTEAADEPNRGETSAEEELKKYDRQAPLRDSTQSGKQWLARVKPTENVPESIPFEDWEVAGSRHQLVMRQWCPQNKTWQGPRLRHPAVYFEDDDLERFGNHYGILQPAVSAGKFYGTLGLLPAKALCQPPCQCQRDVDFPRPGSPQSIAPGCLQTSGQLLSLGPVGSVEFPSLHQSVPNHSTTSHSATGHSATCPNCTPPPQARGGR